MSANDVMAEVADRLVGGMMFHSDHADMMHLVGMDGLASLHENGFKDDSEAFRSIRRKAIFYTGSIASSGNQKSGEKIAKLAGKNRMDIDQETKRKAVEEAMADWEEWEHGTVKLYSRAARDLWGMGEGELFKAVSKLQRSTEKELCCARNIICEMKACGWDMCHILDMQEELYLGASRFGK